jgi:formylglycine-generating enzyme required for sulfatase activity
LAILGLSTFHLSLSAAPPVVSNVRAAQRPGTALVDILYDVSDPDGNSPLRVSFQVSADGGATWTVPVFTWQGAVGPGVLPGNNRAIVWNAGMDWSGKFTSQCRVRVIADDGTMPSTPPGMALIPDGSFQMGDNYNEGETDERPVHTVSTGPFFMDKFEVSKLLWDEVYTWAVGHGYSFDHSGSGVASGHPVQTVCWYCAVKWCNARSQKDGLTPAYYANTNRTAVYTNGNLNLGFAHVNWSANGYRLPTEVEWEKAARGGLPGHHYPWPSLGGTYSSHIDGSRANYYQSGDPYEGPSTKTTPVGYYDGGQSPAGTNMANGYGLYDMAGNVWEWCWDWYDSGWYRVVLASPDQVFGPPSGTYRVLRGGAWNHNANNLRCAERNNNTPDNANNDIGFRCVRGL